MVNQTDAGPLRGRGIHRSVWVPLVYLAVTAVAFALPFIAGAPEAGIWAIVLALPWPLLAIPIIDAIDPSLMDTGLGMVTAGVGALINAFLIRLLFRRREARRRANP